VPVLAVCSNSHQDLFLEWEISLIATQPLRLATFNVRHGAPIDKEMGYPDKLAEACVEIDADILALQEIDVRNFRSGFVNLARVAAQATGMEYVFQRSRMHGFYSPYGNALLVRGHINDVHSIERMEGDHLRKIHMLAKTISVFPENRSALIADVSVKDWNPIVANTHMALNSAVRGQHMLQIIERIDEVSGFDTPDDPQRPAFIMGDLNERWNSVASVVEPHGFTLSEDLPTFPADKPKRGLDHIAGRNVKFGQTITQRFFVSDHLAKITEVHRAD
jgi:endonuclease/exonuclease/phosphatase family metal-dependent hydrolase